MKRLLVCLAVAILPVSAHASSDLARQWGFEAHRLSAETADLIHTLDMGQPVAISDPYVLDVYRFARTSTDLARWVEGAKGSQDIGCVLRRMSAETADLLDALESDQDTLAQRESLRRLTTMFVDAEVLAIAAQRRRPAIGRVAMAMKQTCTGDPQSVLTRFP
jgi:hypothetical protein